nr:MAG TPA: hypothetical protein [Caudoviricetes sp.]
MTGLCAESDFEKCTHRSGKAMRIETKICSALIGFIGKVKKTNKN